MRIAYITAGAAGTICGSCLRDNTLAAELQAQGHDCLLIPTYTPIRTDEVDVSQERVFFGGISVYLQQKSRLFRRMPGLLDRLLSRPGLLRWVSRFAVKTRPEELGDLTISMLKGQHGHQRREVKKLVDYLAREVRPDVVCLTNALLSGFVPELKKALGVPILCTLQGDDIFLEYLPAHFKEEAISLIRENSDSFDAFISTSNYYADFMSGYLGIGKERIHVVYSGINLNGYVERKEGVLNNDGPVKIGYLARICPEKGFHLLVEAFEKLVKDSQLPQVELHVAGYLGERDRPYFEELNRRIAAQGWADNFHHAGEVDHAGKIRFLDGLDIFSVPSIYGEPKALFVFEAWAKGIPVVLPDRGAFPELVQSTGGGVLCRPEDAEDLARQLRPLVLDAEKRAQHGQNGRRAVVESFGSEFMARATLELFESMLAQSKVNSALQISR